VSGVFINYRVGDGATIARALHDGLAEAFGRDEVYFASENIGPGDFFDEHILAAVRACDVLLAVIGPRWLSIAGDNGQAKLDDDEDWVRREIAEALARGIRVVPLLVEKTATPNPAKLPPDIRDLARCNYLRLGYRKGEPDITAVAEQLRPLLRAQAEPTEEGSGLREASGRVEAGSDGGGPGSPRMHASPSGHARSYQAGRDQHITGQ
jgi:hypothetical protein